MSIEDATLQLGIMYEKQNALDAMIMTREASDDLYVTLRATERSVEAFIEQIRKWFPAKVARRVIVDACNLVLT